MRCVIVGSANFKNYSLLWKECRKDDLVVAADGGLNHLKKINFSPNLFVGDMDSVSFNKKIYKSIGFCNKLLIKSKNSLSNGKCAPRSLYVPSLKKSISNNLLNEKDILIKITNVSPRSTVITYNKPVIMSKSTANFLKNTKIIKLPKEKDHTDIFFAVKKAINLGAKEFKIFGGLGQRLDHSYANFCVSKYLAERNIAHQFVSDSFRAFGLKQGNRASIRNQIGKTISVFPFGENCCKVSYKGLKYNLKESYLHANFPLGISNVIVEKQCTISVLEGYALVLVYLNL